MRGVFAGVQIDLDRDRLAFIDKKRTSKNRLFSAWQACQQPDDGLRGREG
jgi:hypothetical protein